MEVLKLSCGVLPTFRFSDSTTKLPPTTTSRRDPPLLLLKARSDLYSFGVTFRIYSSSVYAFPLPARAILSPFFRNRCMPEEVTQIENSEDRNTPSDDNALEEAHTTPDKNIEVVKVPTTKGLLPPCFLYLMDLGLDPDQISTMIRGCPSLVSAEVKIKGLVEFLLDLGASRSDICRILHRCPNLCRYGIQQNIVPKMAFLESLGVVDKSDIVKIMCRYPRLFGFRLQNLKETVNYFVELGVPAEKMNKVLLSSPQIFGLRIENLKETVNYFVELGVPAEKMNKILLSSPQIFGLSIEKKLMPTTKFLLDRGFTTEEIILMLLKFCAFYGYNLEENLMPKWEYFLQMHYQRSDLVSFPRYFGYSLECRIKPRYNLVKKHGVLFTLACLLALVEDDFKRTLENKLKVDRR